LLVKIKKKNYKKKLIVFIILVWIVMKHIYNPKQPLDVPTPYVVVTLLVDDVVINANRGVS